MNFKPNFKKKEELKAKKPTYEPIKKYMVNVTDLITFHPDQPIQEAIDLILEKRISGAPVLDENRKLVGILSEKDCLRIVIDRAYHNMELSQRKVSDYMTSALRTIAPEVDVVTAANEFLIAPVRRFPVVENGVLLGQISRRDILKAAQNLTLTTW